MRNLSRRPLSIVWSALLLSGGSFNVHDVLHAQAVTATPQTRREVVGTVTDSASGLALTGIIVAVPVLGLVDTTDARGHFSISGFLPLTVTVTARGIGFAPVSRRASLASGSAQLAIALTKSVVQLEALHIREDTVARFLDSKQAGSTMSAQQVREKRGQTLGETLKEQPGVAIIQYGPSIAKPVVRGLHSQRIATINGGVPQEGQQWGGEHAPEIDAFAANEIEVIRGPGTILYGSGALGGVVRVKPRALPTDGPVRGEFSTNGFLNNRQAAASLMVEGAHIALPGLHDVGWRLQTTARRAGDARTPDYFLPNTGFKEVDVSGVAGITRTWGRSELSVSHFSTNLGLYLGAHVGNLDDLDRAMKNAFTTQGFAYDLGPPNQTVRHDLVSWHTDILLSNGASLETTYGFQHNDRREFDNHGFAAFGKRPAFGLELFTHSLDVQYHQVHSTRLNGTLGVSATRQGNLSPGRSFLIPQYRLYSAGVFALENLEFQKVTLTAGARFDDRYQHAYQYGAPVIVSPEDEKNYAGPSGTLGATWRASNTWSLASTMALAWRPPNVNERFSEGVHHGTAQFEIGDSSLVPERSVNFDVTLRHLGVKSRLEASGYVNRINDYIFLRPRDPVVTVRGAYPAYNYAHTNALLHGTEVTAQFAPVSWLQLYGNGNVVRGTDRKTSGALYDMPADRLTVSARFIAPTGARAIAPYLEIGSTMVRRQNHVPTVTIYRLPTAGYALLNIEAGATAMHWGRVQLQPNVSIRNVLDTRYRDYLSRYRLFVDDPGRDVVLRLTVPFGAQRFTP